MQDKKNDKKIKVESIMQYLKDGEAEDGKTEDIRMKILRMNHGKEVIVSKGEDIKRCLRIFRDREPIYFTNKEKSGAKEAVDNWNHLVKVFPKETMAVDPISFFFIKETDNPFELQINVDKDQI